MPKLLFILSLMCLIGITVHSQEIANYGIEGWAVNSVGGRGGKIIRVTNLNNIGVGSFADAIAQSGARIIVFEVGGVINMKGQSTKIRNPYITIAGQTAPGKGITVINGPLYVETHDVILQHIRIRLGAAGHIIGSWEPDAFSTNGAYNVIIDHCSFSWAVDENCSASGPRFEGANPDEWRKNTSHTVTISNNIIAEGLSLATHSKGEHSKGTLIHDNATEIAILNNLYASNKDRNPVFKGGARGVVVNNYIYNPGSSAVSFNLVNSEWQGYVYQTGQISIVGNYLQYGPSTSSIAFFRLINGPCQVFLSDNIAKNRSGNDVAQYSGDISKKVTVKPVWNNNIKVIPSLNVQKNIVDNAGARPWDRDETDTRIINEMLTGTGSIINYETSVGGYPTYSANFSPFIANDWNLDYMLKLSPDVSIKAPENGNIFAKDAIITVESEIRSTNDSINFLELLVNGKSEGKVLVPPFKWQISMSAAGSYQLLVIADSKHSMKMATKTIQINISEPITANVQGLYSEPTTSLSASLFPNPFSKTTTISYNLVHPEFVKLTIFNSMGNEVETLVSEFQNAGRHNVTWTTQVLPPGVYFYSLKAGNKVLCNKIIRE